MKPFKDISASIRDKLISMRAALHAFNLKYGTYEDEDDYEDTSGIPKINPANGYPMAGGTDVCGNPLGSSSSDTYSSHSSYDYYR